MVKPQSRYVSGTESVSANVNSDKDIEKIYINIIYLLQQKVAQSQQSTNNDGGRHTRRKREKPNAPAESKGKMQMIIGLSPNDKMTQSRKYQMQANYLQKMVNQERRTRRRSNIQNVKKTAHEQRLMQGESSDSQMSAWKSFSSPCCNEELVPKQFSVVLFISFESKLFHSSGGDESALDTALIYLCPTVIVLPPHTAISPPNIIFSFHTALKKKAVYSKVLFCG